MNHNTLSIRPFIGAKDFNISRSFYQKIGFEEVILGNNLSYFHTDNMGFYLQDAYIKDWIDNTMVFMEVSDINQFYKNLEALNLSSHYQNVRLKEIQHFDWGKECFLHDPSGILWHFGAFNK